MEVLEIQVLKKKVISAYCFLIKKAKENKQKNTTSPSVWNCNKESLIFAPI